MTNTLIDALDKDIDSAELSFILKSRIEKGIYLLYPDMRVNYDELVQIAKRHEDFIHGGGGCTLEELKEKYGFEVDQISEEHKKVVEYYDLIYFELKDN